LTKKYGSLTAAAESLVDDGAPVGFAGLSTYRLEQAKRKLPYVLNYIENLLEENEKVVCFAYHREIIEAIHSHFADSVLLYGGMSDKEKDASVQAFQNGDAKLFIGQVTAAGTGITLTASSTVVFAELDWVPGNVIQAEDRCHRMGQRDNVLVIHLVLKDSIDSRIVQALVRKQQIIEEVIR
jgi:SNF2 family DNA or RNA helicase